MAARQLWLFLIDADVTELLQQLELREPGLVASAGRYLRGEANALLTDPASLERREALPNERRLYLLHRKHSSATVTHRQPVGPFAGWSQIDEERTDCLVLQTPFVSPGQLAPSRLYAHTSFWRSGAKIRKPAPFALWANQTLRWLSTRYPSTSVDFMRIGPQALASCRDGGLRLTYLYREIAPVKQADSPPIAAPPGTLTGKEPDDADGEDPIAGTS